MNVEVEKQANCYCRLIVTLSVDEVDAAYAAATRKVAKSARLPGFRPGKAPRSLLERHMRPQIEQEALDAVLDDTLPKAIRNANVTPVERPVLESVSLKRGASGRYVAGLELYPEVGELAYEGLEAVRYEPSVPPADIDARLGKEQDNHAQTVPAQGRDVVEMGDYVQLDYEGTLGGEKIDGAVSQDTLVHVQPGQYVPGFVEALVGCQVPGEHTANVVFPTNYGNAKLAGQSVQFRFTLHELKVQERPALDDEFAKDCGHESLAAMQAEIEKELLEGAREAAEARTERALLEALIGKNSFEVSHAMLDRQVEGMISDRQERLQQMLGQRYTFSPDEIADLRTSLRPQAEYVVRAGVLTEGLLAQAKIVVDDAALDAYLDDMRAGRAPNVFGTPESLEQLANHAETRDQLRSLLGRREAVARLMQTAQWLPMPPEPTSEGGAGVAGGSDGSDGSTGPAPSA